ncbi:MAG TPA: hypothetical protein VKK61_01935 [Tepidisphaeraceae bacterium]|nr:hypothetical protein [Tepidisphaeraceae bacterium]
MLTALAGCRESKPSSSEQFFQYLRFEDFSGLDSVRWNHDLRVSWAIPDNWEALPMKKTALFAHQQWRSPTASTGVGVAHVALPLPIPAQAFLWFAKNEYMRRARDQKDGRLIGEWTDELGRQWFEAENNRYHVCGYAIARGSEAWIVYSGWRRTREPVPQEIALARRSVESVIPTN